MKIVFIVDDDPSHARICERILKRAGYGVVTANQGDQALKVLAQTTVDVLLLDVIMPGKDGFEVLLALRRTNPTIPVISMSGSSDVVPSRDLLKQCKLLGARRILAKPFTEAALLEAIDAVLAESAAGRPSA